MAKADDQPRAETPPEGDGPEPEGEDEETAAEEQAELDELAAQEAAEEDELVLAHRAYLAAVLDHFGPGAPIHPCPTCQTRGYTEVALQADPTAERCDACQGVGVVATGSVVEGNSTRPCPRCNGAGFRPRPSAEPVRPFEAAADERLLPPEAFPFQVAEPLPLGEAVA